MAVTDQCRLTAKQAAEHLGVSVDWLLDQARAGKIRAAKLGRWKFAQGDLEAFVHDNADAQTKSRLDEARRSEAVRTEPREGRITRRREPPKLPPLPKLSGRTEP